MLGRTFRVEEPSRTHNSTGIQTKTTTRQWNKRRVAVLGSVGLFLVNTMALLIYHVHTTAALEDDTKEYLAVSSEFPVVSTVDKILLAVLVLMAFELLDFLTKNSGSR
jgi:hypothetical protein